MSFTDLHDREVIPRQTEVIITDNFITMTIHLVKENGRTICSQVSPYMRKDHYNESNRKFKYCKRCYPKTIKEEGEAVE